MNNTTTAELRGVRNSAKISNANRSRPAPHKNYTILRQKF